MNPRREMTAKEHGELLERDPKYQAMMAEKAKRRAELEAMFDADEQPLVAALTSVGQAVTSVWDFVNTSASYPDAIPVLAEHLQRPYHFRTREGIARALSVKEARGPAARVVLKELKKMTDARDAGEGAYRFALANALVTIGDSAMQEDVVQMINDPRFKDVHIELKRVIKAIGKRKPT
ncbi:MAG: hypothetical protein WBD40_08330 [Tepidisphaeraceae bacterium]